LDLNQGRTMYDDLLMFIKLATLGSFSQTAKYYNTSQPTITRRIQSLEQNLGIQLLKRNTRNFELTVAGHQLYESVRGYKLSIDSIIRNLRTSDGDLKERLRIALPPAMSFYVISPYIGKFMADNPNISLDIIYQRSAVDLVTQNLDLAVNANPPTSQVVKIKLLHKAYFQLYANKEYEKRFGLPKSIQELSSHTVIGMINSDDTVTKVLYANHMVTGEQIALDNHSCRILSNEGLNIHQIVNSGYAIGGLWDTLLYDEKANQNLIKVFPEYTFSEIPYYLIRDPENKSSSLETLIKFIEECFKRIKEPKI